MNPKSAWLSPRNLCQSLHVLIVRVKLCASQGLIQQSQITPSSWPQRHWKSFMEFSCLCYVLYFCDMCHIVTSVYLFKILTVFLLELAVWGRINTLKPSDAYMRKWIGSSLVRVLLCCPCGTADVQYVHFGASVNIKRTLNTFFKLHSKV